MLCRGDYFSPIIPLHVLPPFFLIQIRPLEDEKPISWKLVTHLTAFSARCEQCWDLLPVGPAETNGTPQSICSR